MSLADVLQPKEQRKLLALDGGGMALDSTDHLDELEQVGRVVATQVQPDHFAGF
jgi:environmental stress-induced protein Ves